MSIVARIEFLNQIEDILSTTVTASEASMILGKIRSIIDNYEFSQISSMQNEGQDNLLQSYIDAMRIQGRSQKTLDRYEYIITKLLRGLNVHTNGITVHHIRTYLANEKARGISDGTLEGYRQIYSAYFNWLQRECLIQRNPMSNLGVIKTRKKIVEVFSDVELECMKYNCDNVRDRAIIEFLISTGCRISEMTSLNISDVDLESLECKVLGKGDKERTVYISSVGSMLLKNYLRSRIDNNPALFIGKGTDRMTPGGIRAMFNRLSETTNINHIHPHKFRRTLATNLIRRGMSIQEVANILGHEKLDTTMRYVLLNKTEIKASYQKYT